MTKEELKQEAEEWLCNNLHSASEEDFIKAMVDIAEPREKRIAELTEQNTSLLTSVENLNKSVQELEAQIEKMKSCENCGWYYLQQHWKESKEINESRMFHCGTCGNKRNWKIKEIKEK